MSSLTTTEIRAARRAVAAQCNGWERMNQWHYIMVDRREQGLEELGRLAITAIGRDRAFPLPVVAVLRLGTIVGEVVAAREELTAAGNLVHALRLETGPEADAVTSEAIRRRALLSARWSRLVGYGFTEPVRID